MTQNNSQGAPAPHQDPSLEVVIPRKVPLAILFALVIQIVGGIWAISGFYYSQKELQNNFKDSVVTLTSQINDIKSTIYTRDEALLQLQQRQLQFDATRQENRRQDQEIQEMRSKLYGRGQ